MKSLSKVAALLLCCALLLSACGKDDGSQSGANSPLGGTNDGFGEAPESLGIYDGKFESVTQEVQISCLSGTAGCYTVEGSTITFTEVSVDSVYAISGQWKGNIVIDTGDDYKFDLEMHGFSMICDQTSPILILSGDEVSLTAKKDYKNFVYDLRSEVDAADETQHSATIYSVVDMEVCGKGSLTVVSENNNGIHTKDDLQVKNVTLTVMCADNALKGNDSVSIESGNLTLISTLGDGIKTTNSNISEKGNQRGTISITGGEHVIYAACDGLDAAYDVIISGDSTKLTIYTDKYSNYSKEVTVVDENVNYIRFTSDAYQYSVKYYNSDDDYVWVDAQYHSTVSGERNSYYYYSYPKMAGYSKVQFFIYSTDQALQQEAEYLVKSDYLTPNSGCDTFALYSRGNQLSYEWTNYTTNIQENFGPGGMGGPGGPGGGPGGGMNEGNPNKGDHSTKGIKANNTIVIENGQVTIKSHDDGIHANADNALENGNTPLGSVTIQGGTITIYSNDDGIHADGKLTVNGGVVTVVNSYEGAEGSAIEINGGSLSIMASDDGMNATATSGQGVVINAGYVYVLSGGDGIDTNSRISYEGIVFNGGQTVLICTSGGNSAIDTEQGYAHNGGSVIAIMPTGGMTNEATHCRNFSSIASKESIKLSAGKYLTVNDGSVIGAVQIPIDLNALVIYLGTNEADFDMKSSISHDMDQNGVYWK